MDLVSAQITLCALRKQACVIFAGYMLAYVVPACPLDILGVKGPDGGVVGCQERASAVDPERVVSLFKAGLRVRVREGEVEGGSTAGTGEG